MFDLQSLATLATARALEAGSQESSKTDPEQNFPARRIFNLRRKFSWAPRNEPVRLKLIKKLDLSIRLFFKHSFTTNVQIFSYLILLSTN